MVNISSDVIKKVVYELCYKANICLDNKVYLKILEAYNKSQNSVEKNRLKMILKNSKIAYEKKRPLCQDTGQVLVFLEIGQNVFISGENLITSVNNAVKECYTENFFRKSTVKNALFDRTNNCENTPAVIYTDIVQGNEIKITVLIKGAGSENKSQAKMLLPTLSKEEIKAEIVKMILSSEINSCPPMFVGIGIGGTLDKAVKLSKEALFKKSTEKEKQFSNSIKDIVNLSAPENFENSYLLDVNLLSTSSHIACMPVAITINCHSSREVSCVIKENNEVVYDFSMPEFIEFEDDCSDFEEIFTYETDKIRNLKKGQQILLTGEMYVARDMAHKMIYEQIEHNEKIALDLNNAVIFYAGPCPANNNEIIGPIGPTTSGRMDKYAVEFYKSGVLATIGKGTRNKETEQVIKETHSVYFSTTGGIASYLADRITSCELVDFADLGTEALLKIQVDKLPVTVEISAYTND